MEKTIIISLLKELNKKMEENNKIIDRQNNILINILKQIDKQNQIIKNK